MAYVLAVAVLFCRPMGKDLSFRTDNGKEAKGKFLLTALANGKFYGGGFCPAPMAKINDGKLELVAVRKVSRWRFLHLVGAFRKGTYLQEPAAETLVFQDCCTRVHIHAKETQKLSMDGEIVPFTHLEVAVEKGGLSFVVPKGSALLEERDVME